MKELFINILLIICAGAITLIPLFGNVKKLDSTHDSWIFARISKLGWTCLIIFAIALILGIYKEFLFNQKIDSDNRISNNQRLKDSLLLDNISKAILDLGFVYNRNTNRIEEKISNFNRVPINPETQKPYLNIYNTPDELNPKLIYINRPNKFRILFLVSNDSKEIAYDINENIFLVSMNKDLYSYDKYPDSFLLDLDDLRPGHWSSFEVQYDFPYFSKLDTLFLYLRIDFKDKKQKKMEPFRAMYCINYNDTCLLSPYKKYYDRVKMYLQNKNQW